MIQTALWNRLCLFAVCLHVLGDGSTFLGSVGVTQPSLPAVGGNVPIRFHLGVHHYCIALHRVLTWPMVRTPSFEERMTGMGHLHSCCDRPSVGLAAGRERPLACHGNRMHSTVNSAEYRHGCRSPLTSQGRYLYPRACWLLPGACDCPRHLVLENHWALCDGVVHM